MERLGVPALSRASPYLYNTEGEIDQLFEALQRVERLFAGRHVARPAPAQRGL